MSGRRAGVRSGEADDVGAPVQTRASPTRRDHARARPSRRRSRRRRRGLALITLIVVPVTVSDVALRISQAGEIVPGTRMAAIDLGGMSREDAGTALAAASAGGGTVTLTYGDRRFSVRAREVGLRVDAVASAERAYRDGRRGLWAAVSALWGGRDVDPVVELERSRLKRAVAGIAREVDRAPFYGALSVDRGGTIQAEPPRDGRAVEQQATAAYIVKALTDGAGAVVRLPVRIRSTVARRHVDAVARAARAYVQLPLRLRGGGQMLKLDGEELAAVLDVERTKPVGSAPLRLGVDEPLLERLVADLSEALDRDPVDARLSAPARPIVVEAKGDLAWSPRRASVQVTPARAGRRLDRPATAAAVARAVREQRHSVRLVLRRVPAAVRTRAARDVTSILGTFTTHFACCEPRTTNIALIAKAVDNSVIRPGEQFSLNRVAGPRTSGKGYKPAPFIADGKIVPSVGGGVSQFSTTMYNAAYFAGLRIDHHQPHSFYIDRYPAGREATLDYTSIDLLWTNDTDAPVLLRTSIDATSVTVTLYGASEVRRVAARSGPRVDGAGGGFTTTVTRSITYRSGRSVRQSYTTRYDAPPAA